jgi:hypothetical protein
MSKVTRLKHAAKEVAKERGLKIPDGFDPDAPTLGQASRVLLRRISHSKAAVDWTPAKVANWLVRVAKGRMIYTQGADRMEGVREKIRPPNWPHHADCSSLATWIYWVSGYPDPNGRGYDGFGYTGTLDDHGVRVSRANIRLGDLVFYANPDHVAVYVGRGRVVGFGHQGGPDNDPIGYRTVAQIRHYSH